MWTIKTEINISWPTYFLIQSADKLNMTKTNTANTSTTMSTSKACITAAVFCCLLAFFVPESVSLLHNPS